MIVVDTSALIDSLVGARRSAARMRALIEEGERLVLPTLVLYEWWRGPRQREELAAQEALFPSETAGPFGIEQAALASRLYRQMPRARGTRGGSCHRGTRHQPRRTAVDAEH